MKVEQLMTRNVETCTSQDTLATAARIMWERDCGIVPVVGLVDDDAAPPIVGMLTDRDICMAAYTQGRPLHDIPVATAMSQSVCSCRPTDAIGVALKVMQTNQIRRLPVVDGDDRLIGMLSLADLAREATRENGQKTRAITDEMVGSTLEVVCQSRSAPGNVVSAA